MAPSCGQRSCDQARPRYGLWVRWDELFADIEGQFEGRLDAERLDLAAESERLRVGRVTLIERLAGMSSSGRVVRLLLSDAQTVDLRIDSTGSDWVAGEAQSDRSRGAVVPVAAIAEVLSVAGRHDLIRASPPLAPARGLAARIGLAVVLRDLCRRRIEVELRTTLGIHHGTIDRVGADHLDLARHGAGEARRHPAVQEVRLVPFAGLLCVRL